MGKCLAVPASLQEGASPVGTAKTSFNEPVSDYAPALSSIAGIIFLANARNCQWQDMFDCPCGNFVSAHAPFPPFPTRQTMPVACLLQWGPVHTSEMKAWLSKPSAYLLWLTLLAQNKEIVFRSGTDFQCLSEKACSR